MNYFRQMLLSLDDNYYSTLMNMIPSHICKITYEPCLIIQVENVWENVFFLKNHNLSDLNCLVFICGIDYPERENRFEILYDFLSLSSNCRLSIKTSVNEITPIKSIVSIFPSANWWEREIWDLFGVFFIDHPDLRRILTDYGFQGFPLRKDFPLTGYVEVVYDEKLKHVKVQPLQITQEFRFLDVINPWSTLKNLI
uniref:NADH dehydrogenase subunit 9 n=1 Tax=Vischeria stellata TaxID=1104407 RepID=A0A481XJ26_9STRA|nr:NADH dehydrogenase subunit 9 [Vischeria stellata]QBK36859.1 NADH dehydrogenase subunit 9 [Vischeria stellata]